MNKEQKQEVVEKVASLIDEANSVIAVDYRGIDVPQINELRAKLREADSTFRIVKNSLTERAADKAGEPEIKSLIEGPTAFTFVRGDVAMAAKALNKFVRDEKVIEFRGGFIEGSVITAEDLGKLAKLPTSDQLRAQLVSAVSSPLTVLVRGLNSMIGGLVIALADLQKKRESEEPKAEEPKAEEPKAEEPKEEEPKEEEPKSEETEEKESKESESEEPKSEESEVDEDEEPAKEDSPQLEAEVDDKETNENSDESSENDEKV